MSSGARLLLLTRALLATPDVSEYAPNAESHFEWEVRPQDGVIESNVTIYTDGSMVDGPSPDIGRVGFGIVAINEEGEVVAKGFGTPPAWINSVPGAETWALYEALRNMVPGSSIRSDCAAVVKRFKAGKKAATSSKV